LLKPGNAICEAGVWKKVTGAIIPEPEISDAAQLFAFVLPQENRDLT
jgi:hypothetical protein